MYSLLIHLYAFTPRCLCTFISKVISGLLVYMHTTCEIISSPGHDAFTKHDHCTEWLFIHSFCVFIYVYLWIQLEQLDIHMMSSSSSVFISSL